MSLPLTLLAYTHKSEKNKDKPTNLQHFGSIPNEANFALEEKNKEKSQTS